MIGPEEFRRLYPDQIRDPTFGDIVIFLFFFSLPLLIPYIYIKFFENIIMSFTNFRLIPFIKFRLHLVRFIHLINKILKFELKNIYTKR